jgi:hypothetical protein
VPLVQVSYTVRPQLESASVAKVLRKLSVKTIWIILAICLGTDLTQSVIAQEKSIPAPPPGKIVLMPGYISTRDIGGDSYSGIFSKPGSVSIKFDIGLMAGDAVKYRLKAKEPHYTWFKDQIMQGKRVEIMRGSDPPLIISFPDTNGNFYATPKTESDLADVLLMVSTYTQPEIKGKQ